LPFFCILASMRNLMMAAYSGYKTVDKVQNFVESFLRFKGDHDHLFIMSDQSETEIDDYLKEKGVEHLKLPEYTSHPYNDRFIWFSQALEAWDEDGIVMSCDIRDVVFQGNPFNEVIKRMRYDMLYVSENIDFREQWNGIMLKYGFPHLFEKMLMRPVYNCGVMAGKAGAAKQMYKELFDLANSASSYAKFKDQEILLVPDQAAYSILVNLGSWKSKGTVTSNIEGLVFTAATAPFDIKRAVVRDGFLCNHLGQRYTIVHQYDRLSEILNYDDGVFSLGPEKLTDGLLNLESDEKELRYYFKKGDGAEQ